jgi:PAS domain S-box-containing protein
VGALWTALIVALGYGVWGDQAMGSHFWVMVAFTALFAASELLDLSFYDKEVTWGLTQCEAILLPMLVTLSFGEVAVAAVVGMGIARMFDRSENLDKQTFNLVQYGCAAAAASGVYHLLAGYPDSFTPGTATAAVAGILVFAVLTHVFVATAFQVAGRGRFVDALTDVASVTLINLLGNIVLGLLFAAAFISSPWTIALFPVALAALYAGYRAVVRQHAERRRMEQLHEASRALAGAPDLRSALDGFLKAVAETASATGAVAVVATEDGHRLSSVYEGRTVELLGSFDDARLADLLVRLDEAGDGHVTGEVVGDLLGAVGVRDLLGVPLVEEGTFTGFLGVVDRTGADEFSADDVGFLRALAGELALTLHSYRLFDQVAEEREKFHLLVDGVTDYAIYLLDPDGYVISWNQGAERILGYESSQILGRHFSLFYPADANADCPEELSVAADRGRHEVEGWRIRKDGSRFLVNEVVSPVTDERGALRGFAKVTRDITELAQASREKETLKEQLHQSQKLESVGQLAGGIAHDFNNLLSVVLNCTHFLIEQLEENSPIREDVLEIKSAAQRATSLTRQLLIFSRRDMIQPQLVSLNEIIVEIERLLSRAIGEDIAINTMLDPDLGCIKADPGQIEQILMNLAVNARDAMTGGGVLTIETSPVELDPEVASRYVDLAPGSYVSLRVKDTGSGMDPAVIQKAFDPFFTTKPKGKGTGLGLATVYGIVRSASGHISIRSEVGLGTTFEILLPLVAEPASLPEIVDVPVEHDGGGKRILLVEDEDRLRSVAVRLLSQHGYEVMSARNGRDALFQIGGAEDSIDLLLTDVVMPEMSGVELAERLRERVPGLRVVLMSGYSAGVFSQGSSIDFEVLPKPFEPHELLAAVGDAIHRDTAGAA